MGRRILHKVSVKISALIPFLFVFVASLYLPTDPDLGWHLKYGEYFFTHGEVLRENIFSVMMPDFLWANGQWGTDLITFYIYNSFGFWGLSVAAGLAVTGIFYFISKGFGFDDFGKIILAPFLVYLESPINSVSFRGQQLSLLLTAVLVFILSRYQSKKNIIVWLPVLFLIWANIHEQFFLGLGILGIWISVCIGRLIFLGSKQKGFAEEIVKLAGIFIFCLLITLLNPFGIGVHIDALSHFGNPLLKDVVEYLPFEQLSYLWWLQVIAALFAFCGFLIIYFRKRFWEAIPLMSAALVVFILSFEVRRYAWTAYYLLVPMFAPLVKIIEPDSKKLKLYSGLLIGVMFLAAAIFLGDFSSLSGKMNWREYCKSKNTSCSFASAEYIQRHGMTDKLFSYYGWGGWLIWNYPTIKPTIDGRMHVWESGGYSAFKEYYLLEQNLSDINISGYEIVYMSPAKPLYSKMQKLTDADLWEKVYEDKWAGIFVKKNKK